MNQICLVGCANEEAFLEQLAAGFQLGEYFVGRAGSEITFKNRYFEAVLSFTTEFDAETAYDGLVYFGAPRVYPLQHEALETLVVLSDAAEIGQFDTGDFLFEYVYSADELAELLAQTAWQKFKKLENTEQQADADAFNTKPCDSMNSKIDALIDAISNRAIQQEVYKARQALKMQDDDSLESFSNAFIIIESLQEMLKRADDDDRKFAAAAIALLLGEELGGEPFCGAESLPDGAVQQE